MSPIDGLKDGVWKIVEPIPDVMKKALVWVSFDSGFRMGKSITVELKMYLNVKMDIIT